MHNYRQLSHWHNYNLYCHHIINVIILHTTLWDPKFHGKFV